MAAKGKFVQWYTQNSAKCLEVFEFSARKVGPNVYTWQKDTNIDNISKWNVQIIRMKIQHQTEKVVKRRQGYIRKSSSICFSIKLAWDSQECWLPKEILAEDKIKLLDKSPQVHNFRHATLSEIDRELKQEFWKNHQYWLCFPSIGMILSLFIKALTYPLAFVVYTSTHNDT